MMKLKRTTRNRLSINYNWSCSYDAKSLADFLNASAAQTLRPVEIDILSWDIQKMILSILIAAFH
jgi:hypothetical protein